MEKNIIKKIIKKIKNFFTYNETNINYLEEIKNTNREILFANIFQDSIANSDWLEDRSFSPFQSAANYSFLYKLFKIYDIWQPKNILEFGLGQSTRLTSQYIKNKNKKATAIVLDDSEQWIEIYKKQVFLSNRLQIIKRRTTDFYYNGTKSLNSRYEKLPEILKGKKFNLIIIDGPVGGQEYPRNNVIDLLDEYIAKEWLIVIDDAERKGEKNTISLLQKNLDAKGIAYKTFQVDAIKSQYFICAVEIYNVIFSI